MSRSQKDITDHQLQIDIQDILSSVDEAIVTLTEEDRRILQECIKESFYSRGLPFSAVAMIATKLLISRGVLKPSLPKIATHWARALKSSLPKIAIAYAGLVGLCAGTILLKCLGREIPKSRKFSTGRSPSSRTISTSATQDIDTSRRRTVIPTILCMKWPSIQRRSLTHR